MRQTFLEFLSNKNTDVINEAFRNQANSHREPGDNDVEKAQILIDNVLKKHIPNLIPIDGGYKMYNGKSGELYGKQYIVVDKSDYSKSSMFQINWKYKNRYSSSEVYSIDFFKDLKLLFDGKDRSVLTIYTLGSSVMYFMPIIWTVATSKNYKISETDAIKVGKSILGKSIFGENDPEYSALQAKKTILNDTVKESSHYVGALEYKVYEGLSNKVIDDAFELATEARNDIDKELKAYKKNKFADMQRAWLDRNTSDKAKSRFKELEAEYNEIKNAIKGGASTIGELKLALAHNVNITAELDENEKALEKQLKEVRQKFGLVFQDFNLFPHYTVSILL